MDFVSIIEDLYRQIEDLKKENTQLRQENERLKERLGLNSTNSSLPPSRDLYRAKKNRSRSGRKPGAQPGHKPQGYQLKAADEIIEVFPDICTCGHRMDVGSTYNVDQKLEIPPLKPYVTEYHLYHGVCRACGNRKTADLERDHVISGSVYQDNRGFFSRLYGLSFGKKGHLKCRIQINKTTTTGLIMVVE